MMRLSEDVSMHPGGREHRINVGVNENRLGLRVLNCEFRVLEAVTSYSDYNITAVLNSRSLVVFKQSCYPSRRGGLDENSCSSS